MRIPIRMPPTTVTSNPYGGEPVSSLSTSGPSGSVPYHRSQHTHSTGRAMPSIGEDTMSNSRRKGSKRRQFRRSAHLQATLDRIQLRRDLDAVSSPRAEGDDNGDHDDDQQQQREVDPKVGQVLEMMYKYDTILDHLVHKNRRLRRREYHPSTSSYTTTEVLDTLGTLRRQREQTFGKGKESENSKEQTRSQSRSKGYSTTGRTASCHYEWENSPRHNTKGYYSSREIGQTLPLGIQPLASSLKYVPPEIQIDEHEPKRLNFAPMEYHDGWGTSDTRGYQDRERAQSMLQAMEGYKRNGYQFSGEGQRSASVPRESSYRVARDAVDMHRSNYPQRPSREYYYNPRQAPSRSTWGERLGPPRYSGTYERQPILYEIDEQHSYYDDTPQRGFQRRDDVVELERRDFHYEPGRPSFTNRTPAGSHIRESAPVSPPVPVSPPEQPSIQIQETTPPRIRESRDRIAQFRSQKLKDESSRNQPDPMEIARESISRSPSRKNSTRDAIDNRNSASLEGDKPEFVDDLMLPHEGSKDRPVDVKDYDSFGRKLEDTHFQTTPNRGPSAITPSPRQQRTPPSRRRQATASSSIVVEPNRVPRDTSLLSARNTISPISRLNSEDLESSVTPSEQARKLRSQVNDVYVKSKNLVASQEQMKHDIHRIKELYQSRSESMQERVFQVASSTSFGLNQLDSFTRNKTNQPPKEEEELDLDIDLEQKDSFPLDLRPALELSSDSEDGLESIKGYPQESPGRSYTPSNSGRNFGKMSLKVHTSKKGETMGMGGKNKKGAKDPNLDPIHPPSLKNAPAQGGKSRRSLRKNAMQKRSQLASSYDDDNDNSSRDSSYGSYDNEQTAKAILDLQGKLESLSKSESFSGHSHKFLSSSNHPNPNRNPHAKFELNLEVLDDLKHDQQRRLDRTRQIHFAPGTQDIQQQATCIGIPCLGR